MRKPGSKKKLLLGVTVLIAIAGFAYLYSQSRDNSNNSEQATEPTIEERFKNEQPDFFFSSVTGQIDRGGGVFYRISATGNQNLYGECTYVFVRDNQRVTDTSSSFNSDTCQTKVPLNRFTEHGTWDVAIYYQGSEDKALGFGFKQSLIVDPNPKLEKFDITASSVQQVGDNVTATAELPKALNGICIFGFSGGTNMRSATAAVKNASGCEASIPAADIPKGLWHMDVTFLSDDGLVSAHSLYTKPIVVK